jgi:hypothetical protein
VGDLVGDLVTVEGSSHMGCGLEGGRLEGYCDLVGGLASGVGLLVYRSADVYTDAFAENEPHCVGTPQGQVGVSRALRCRRPGQGPDAAEDERRRIGGWTEGVEEWDLTWTE